MGELAALSAFQPLGDGVLGEVEGVQSCSREVVEGEDEPGGQGMFMGSGKTGGGGASDEQRDARVQSDDFEEVERVRSELGRDEHDAEGDIRGGQLCTQGPRPLGNDPFIPFSGVDIHDAVGRSHGREAIESHAVGKQRGGGIGSAGKG